MSSATKDIRIGETNYQLGRLSARNGSWIVNQFVERVLGRLNNPDRELTEKDLGLGLALDLQNLSEETFLKVQAKCLEVCKRYGTVGDSTIPMPVLRADGKWNDTAEPSLPELLALTVSCLSFNLYSFFESGALETLLIAFPNMNIVNSGSPK
jgi:hypothetical protein